MALVGLGSFLMILVLIQLDYAILVAWIFLLFPLTLKGLCVPVAQQRL